MSKIEIEIKGVSAELVLGNYMPKDPTIYEEWQEFYRYDDLIHESQLFSGHISEISILKDGESLFKGQIPKAQYRAEKSFIPVLEQNSLYLRTECVENAVYKCNFETDSFELSKLTFQTQDYDLLFKVGDSFLTRPVYDGQPLTLDWISGQPVGNICVLCRCENGFLIPEYDAIKKVKAPQKL